MQTGVI